MNEKKSMVDGSKTKKPYVIFGILISIFIFCFSAIFFGSNIFFNFKDNSLYSYFLGQHPAVYPDAAKNIEPVELGQAILSFMPNENDGDINWNFRSNSKNIAWLDSPYVQNEDGVTRTGLMRINVEGETSKILKKTSLELAWTVRYEAMNSRFGVEKIYIAPGYAHASLGDSNETCFGELFENCEFSPLKSLERSNISYKKICENSSIGPGDIFAYELNFQGKKSAVLVWSSSVGSGGASSEIYLYPAYAGSAPKVSGREKSYCESVFNGEPEEESGAPVVDLPMDVTNFLDRRNACDHFRSEPPIDKEREAFIVRKVCENCAGTDAELAQLRKKYEGNKEIISKLADYEKIVEPIDKKKWAQICSKAKLPKSYQ